MIVNDMSQVNVEVKVDETDIKDVKMDQPAKVKVDALGEKEIVGKVVQIAASAISSLDAKMAVGFKPLPRRRSVASRPD